ncbi:MAG: hypothetical protein LUD72_07440 [Bacteroidales bacterium]|nr:hypothetical protein [Bacteroidales bacterium]
MMALVTFLAYILATFGLTELVIFFDGPLNILSGFRKAMNYFSPSLGKLVGCPACFSTWVGIILSTVNYLFITVPFTPFNLVFRGTNYWWLIVPLDCFLTAGTTWTLYQLDEYLEKNSVEYEED